MATMTPRRREIRARSSGYAHKDTYPSTSKCARLLRIHRTTANRYTKNGGRLHELADYVTNADDKFRLLAHLQSMVIQDDIKDLSKADLIKLYHDTLEAEPTVESEDRTLDVSQGACWLDRARASEQDSAINAKKAAIEREFAERDMSDAEVWGR